MRRMNARSKDLENLLRGRTRCKHEITNGNHRIAITAGRHPPSTERCEECPNHLACFAGRQDEALRYDGEWMLRPCYEEQRFVEFYYHGSCCLAYDVKTGAVTDLGMWGYSVTTSRAIRWYLEAIADNYPNHLTGDRIHELTQLFKKRNIPRLKPYDALRLPLSTEEREKIGWITL